MNASSNSSASNAPLDRRSPNRSPTNSPQSRDADSLTDVHAEKALIGSLMLLPEKVDEVTDVVRPADFWSRELGLLYGFITALVGQGKELDAVVLSETAAASREFGRSAAEARELLYECLEAVPHGARARAYAEIIRGKWKRRELCYTGQNAIELATAEHNEIGDALGTVETRLHGIIERESGDKSIDMTSLLLDTIEALNTGKRDGLKVGFHELDKMTNGLQAGTMTILAARPSVGKTAFAISLLLRATREGSPALFLSLEQTRLEVGERILSIQCGLSVNRMRQKPPDPGVCESVLQASQELSDLPLYVDDRSDLDMLQIGATIRLWKRRKGIKLVVLDYLQLVRPADPRAPREQQVSRISKELKSIAKSMELPIVVLAQLNRQIDSRVDKKPKLSDLRESGAIEQDADLVIFLDRPHVYDTSVDEGLARLFVEKHRNGPKGEVPLQWTGDTMHYRPGTTADESVLDSFYGGRGHAQYETTYERTW